MLRTFISEALVLAVVVGLGSVARAEWIKTTEDVPVERLVTNLRARLAERPKDAHAHYVLGRIHSMAWWQKADIVEIELPKKDGDVPRFAPWQSVQLGRDVTEGNDVADPGKSARDHYHRSITHYRSATKLDGEQAIHYLGLGYMLQDGARYVRWLRTPDGSMAKRKFEPGIVEKCEDWLTGLTADDEATRGASWKSLLAALPQSAYVLERFLPGEDGERTDAVVRVLRYHWQNLSADAYRRSHALALPADLAADAHGCAGDAPVSLEAAMGLLKILETRVRSDGVTAEIETLKKRVKKLDALPRWETPIVFPLRGDLPLEALIDEGKRVSFDLDGDGVARRWPWVRSDVGVLVWDPDGDGRITSGRELFGGRTWWIRWDDGYAPLASLDDDRDGCLVGGELDGIAVWIDANGNAKSDRGEIRSAHASGIRTVNVRSDGVHAGVPHARSGVTFEDGRSVPTYDWTPRRAAE